MAEEKDKFKEELLKKTLLELETLISDQKHRISKEKNLITLNRLNSELKTMKDIHEQKLIESGRHIQKGAKPSSKPVLKSYDDYIKSKSRESSGQKNP